MRVYINSLKELLVKVLIKSAEKVQTCWQNLFNNGYHSLSIQWKVSVVRRTRPSYWATRTHRDNGVTAVTWRQCCDVMPRTSHSPVDEHVTYVTRHVEIVLLYLILPSTIVVCSLVIYLAIVGSTNLTSIWFAICQYHLLFRKEKLKK